MYQETETHGIVDPEHIPDPESEDMEQAIERFRTDPPLQEIYSEYAEALDSLVEKAKAKFTGDLEGFEAFVDNLSSNLIEAEEKGKETIDVIEDFSALVL